MFGAQSTGQQPPHKVWDCSSSTLQHHPSLWAVPHLEHCDAALCQLWPLLVKIVPVLEKSVCVALVKQVPVAASIILVLGCVMQQPQWCGVVCDEQGS